MKVLGGCEKMLWSKNAFKNRSVNSLFLPIKDILLTILFLQSLMADIVENACLLAHQADIEQDKHFIGFFSLPVKFRSSTDSLF